MTKDAAGVYIIGAGPGDPELLTHKAYKFITEQADIVIYDRLVSEEIIALIPEHIPAIYAGKSCRKHHMTQEEINQELVKQAASHRVVVRLKGGDPYIFGRGGEEALYLYEHNIPFTVIPGISAASGCSSYYGIPLTHRGIATGVQYITGHKQKGTSLTHNWQALADSDTTLVIYMGLANIEEIVTQLMQHGLAEDTPVALIQEGTTAQGKVYYSDLANIVIDITSQKFSPPTLIIIGKVVSLAEKLYIQR